MIENSNKIITRFITDKDVTGDGLFDGDIITGF